METDFSFAMAEYIHIYVLALIDPQSEIRKQLLYIFLNPHKKTENKPDLVASEICTDHKGSCFESTVC